MKSTNGTKIILGLILLGLYSCKPSSPNTVTAVVGRILEPVSITSTPDFEFDEVVTSDDGIDVTITVSNNSSDAIRDLNYTFDTSENIFDYRPNIDGIAVTPGAGGSCQTTLNPNSSCTYRLVLTPRKQGEFNIHGTISYTNRIEAQVKNINYHLISGTPASLVFTNDVSNYSFGIFEQTEPTERFVDLEVQNTGGLSAKELAVAVNNDDIAGAYKLISHNCPTKLISMQKCQARVSYTPKNNNYTDPETIYTGQLAFDFIKDPTLNTGRLNGYFSFTSSTIEAKFKTNYAQVDFGTVVTGNKEMRMIKLINMGYREGILKQLILKTSTGAIAATCVKGTGSILNCGATLYDFPFTVEDTSNCFENVVVSYLATSGSPNCIFKLTYWPSVGYPAGSQAIHDFNNSSLSFTYDSKWKGNVNIVTKDNVFNILSNFTAKADVRISRVSLNGVDLLPGNITTVNNISSIQLGRLAKIAAGYPGVFYPLVVYYKNYGEVDAAFIKADSGEASINTFMDVTSSPPPTVSRDLNSYYKGVKVDAACLILNPNSECGMLMNLAPVVMGITPDAAEEAAENALMYDNITNAFNKYKDFKYYYSDGSAFNDDGSAVTSRNVESRVVSLLIAKGKLILNPAATLPFGSTIVVGDKVVKNLQFKNIGTGKIAGIQFKGGNASLEAAVVATLGVPAYPYRISKYSDNAESIPAGSDYDCYDIIRGSAVVFPFVVDSSKILDVGKTCSLRIEAKLPKNSTTLTKAVPAPTDEYKRFWAMGVSSTADAWMAQIPSIGTVKPFFYYWDGDDNHIADVINSTLYFGYKSTSDALNITSSWIKPAMLYINNIEPIASSVLFKPTITYPIVNETFPTPSTLGTSNVAFNLFANTDLLLGSTGTSLTAIRSTYIKNYFTALGTSYYGASVNTPMVYMGTTKASTDLVSLISFTNYGTEVPSQTKMVDAGGAAGFTLTKFSGLTGANVYTPVTSGTQTFTLDIKVNIATPGLYQHCYDVIYTTVLGDRDYKFCVVADIVANAPNLKVEYKNNDVNWNTSTISFDVTPDAAWSSFKSPINKLSTCNQYDYTTCAAPGLADEILFFSTVYSTAPACVNAKNCQFDKKTVRLTNTGTAPITDFKLELIKTPANNYATNSNLPYPMNPTQCAAPTSSATFGAIVGKIAYCQSEVDACNNLAPGATCTINFMYTPTSSVTAATDSMLSLSYRMNDRSSVPTPNAYTYANQYIPIKYEALASAIPTAVSYLRNGIDSVNFGTWPYSGSSQTITGADPNVGNWSDPTAPNSSESSVYPIKLGAYAINYGPSTIVNTNYIENAMPQQMDIYVLVKNTSSTRVSFLKANPNANTATIWGNQVYPPWDYTTNSFKTYPSNYGAAKATIFASEGCFWGEVYADGTVASNNKGFNATTETYSAGAKKCVLKISFKGDITYLSGCIAASKTKTVQMGGDIDSNCNPYVFKIPFWSFKRSTSLDFKVHIKEFMEPNRSNYSGSINGITASYLTATTAKISFNLPTTISEGTVAYGAITKYRIFWAKDASYLRQSEIFKQNPNPANLCWQDTANATLPQTVNLSTCTPSAANTISPGKYWFIKVMAIRSTAGSTHPNKAEVPTFTSDPKIPIVMVPTPNNANLTYVDTIKAFVDSGLIDTAATYNYTNAIAKCANAANNLTITNGATGIANPRALINFNVFSYIRSGTVPSNISLGYSAMGPGYVPHWLSDPAVAINTSSVKLYSGATLTGGFPSFNVVNPTGSNGTKLISYNKGCSTAACNNLNVIAGGDNDTTYANGVFYTYATNKAGFVRCYVPIVCPTNTGKPLSDAVNCVLKY